jgi:ABC-type transporter Mla maintaining outer membrane lipid asymmetry permease subunit MlaE
VVSLEHLSFQLQHKIPELERLNWGELEMLTIAGQLQVVIRSITGRVHVRNTLQQLELIGPRSLGVSLLTASFVGMVFTIQVHCTLFHAFVHSIGKTCTC